MELRRKVTVCNSYAVVLARLDAGATPVWVWPPESRARILKRWSERRAAAFNASGQYLGGKKKNRKWGYSGSV